jgi:hypothetical protein
MKPKKLSALLKKMAEHTSFSKNGEGISSLNDKFSEMIIGGKATTNGVCMGKNMSCLNGSCAGTTNGTCGNVACIMPDELDY